MAEVNKFTAKYDIAGLKILMTTYYDRTRKLASDYLAKTEWDEPDYVIDLGVNYYEIRKTTGLGQLSEDDIEYVATGSYFNRILIIYLRFYRIIFNIKFFLYFCTYNICIFN